MTFNLPAHAYAHRGLWSADIPENSLLAFKRAASHGFGAECDVHLSADGVPMVFHDFSLDRMTSHQGELGHHTAEQLQAMRLNNGHDAIPKLADVLAVMKDAPLLIELKARENTDLPSLASSALMLAAHAIGPVAIMSFSAPLISICKQISSHMSYGLLADPRQVSTPEGAARFERIIADLKPDFIGPNVSQLTTVKALHEAQRTPIASWTVRREDQLTACVQAGAAPIFENLSTDLVRAVMAS